MSHAADIKLLQEERSLLSERIAAIDKEMLKLDRVKLKSIRGGKA